MSDATWGTKGFFANASPEKVRQALAAGADPKAADHLGRTPLHLAAAAASDSAVIGILLEAGASVAARTVLSQTPLHLAAEGNDEAAISVALIEAGADVEAVGEQGSTPLRLAARGNEPEVVQVLIDAGARPDAARGRGETALHQAVCRSSPDRRELVVEMLLDAGADPGARAPSINGRGKTALMLAAQTDRTGQAWTVRHLIEFGADLNETGGFERRTALLEAACRGNSGAMGALLEAGADPDIGDSDGQTAIMRVIGASGETVLDDVRDLLAAGADPDRQDKRGWTALHHAVWRRHPQVVQTLLEHGADRDLPDSGGRTVSDLVDAGAAHPSPRIDRDLYRWFRQALAGPRRGKASAVPEPGL